MEQDFYKKELLSSGIEVLIPNKEDREIINRIIYDELCHGNIFATSKKDYLRIIDGLTIHGAQGVILGCTEIGLLIKQTDTSLPVFDTTIIHAKAAVEAALSNLKEAVLL